MANSFAETRLSFLGGTSNDIYFNYIRDMSKVKRNLVRSCLLCAAKPFNNVKPWNIIEILDKHNLKKLKDWKKSLLFLTKNCCGQMGFAPKKCGQSWKKVEHAIACFRAHPHSQCDFSWHSLPVYFILPNFFFVLGCDPTIRNCLFQFCMFAELCHQWNTLLPCKTVQWVFEALKNWCMIVDTDFWCRKCWKLKCNGTT